MIDEVPVLPPLEALRFFRDKGFAFGFAWADVWQDEHAAAFTVAKAMSRDVLETIRQAVDAAIADGTTLETFQRDLTPRLQELGWWGRRTMIDPLTAQAKTVQLGSPRRLRTIFQVNMRTAYQAGRWERIDRQKKAFPFLRYSSVMDGRERPQHHAWHGTVRPVDDAWWDTHYPPCGWNCRCTATAFNRRQLDKRGYSVTEEPAIFPATSWTNKRTGEVHEVEGGIDPGWAYNVGKARLASLAAGPIPGSAGDADIADATGAAAAIASFFAAFGITASEAKAGRVIEDAGGWPLAVSLAWLQQDGRTILPAPAKWSGLAIAGLTLAGPSEIRWVWVTGADGAAMLMRRYLLVEDGRVACAVEVGRAGWRFLTAADGDVQQLRRGKLAWSVEQAAIAGYDPHQRRDSTGKWTSRHAEAVAYADAVKSGAPDAPADHRLAPVGSHVLDRFAALGLSQRPVSVALDRSRVRHIHKRHGNDRLPQKPIRSEDVARAHLILDRGTIVHGTPKVGPGGEPRLFVSATIGPDHYEATFEVRKYRAVLHTLRRR